MAPESVDDTLIRISGDVAHEHVDKYYRATDRERESLPSFYAHQALLPDGSQVPTIIFNGNPVQDAAAFRDLLKEFGPMSHDIQCFDCQVINPIYSPDGGTAENLRTDGRNATVAVLVSGTVKIGPPREAELRGFSESFVLVPNPAYSKDRRKKNSHEWVIQSQCFRFVS